MLFCVALCNSHYFSLCWSILQVLVLLPAIAETMVYTVYAMFRPQDRLDMYVIYLLPAAENGSNPPVHLMLHHELIY